MDIRKALLVKSLRKLLRILSLKKLVSVTTTNARTDTTTDIHKEIRMSMTLLYVKGTYEKLWCTDLTK